MDTTGQLVKPRPQDSAAQRCLFSDSAECVFACLTLIAMVITTSLDVIPPNFGPNLLLEGCTERCKGRAYQLFAENYVSDVRFEESRDEFGVKARCYRSMRKSLDAHVLNVCFAVTSVGEATITDKICSYTAGYVLFFKYFIGNVLSDLVMNADHAA